MAAAAVARAPSKRAAWRRWGVPWALLAACAEPSGTHTSRELPPISGVLEWHMWGDDDLCDVVIPFQGEPFTGDCRGCTYAFAVDLPAPSEPCPGGWWWFDDDEDTDSLALIAFDPEFWHYREVNSWNYWYRMEETLAVCDFGPDQHCRGAEDWGWYGSNALEDYPLAFDGTSLYTRHEFERAWEGYDDTNLWAECDDRSTREENPFDAVPEGATTIPVPCPGDTLREWRYSFEC